MFDLYLSASFRVTEYSKWPEQKWKKEWMDWMANNQFEIVPLRCIQIDSTNKTTFFSSLFMSIVRRICVDFVQHTCFCNVPFLFLFDYHFCYFVSSLLLGNVRRKHLPASIQNNIQLLRAKVDTKTDENTKTCIEINCVNCLDEYKNLFPYLNLLMLELFFTFELLFFLFYSIYCVCCAHRNMWINRVSSTKVLQHFNEICCYYWPILLPTNWIWPFFANTHQRTNFMGV